MEIIRCIRQYDIQDWITRHLSTDWFPLRSMQRFIVTCTIIVLYWIGLVSILLLSSGGIWTIAQILFGFRIFTNVRGEYVGPQGELRPDLFWLDMFVRVVFGSMILLSLLGVISASRWLMGYITRYYREWDKLEVSKLRRDLEKTRVVTDAHSSVAEKTPLL